MARIDGATASGRPRETEPVPLPASTTRSEQGSRTRVVLDLGHANMPVDELRVTAATRTLRPRARRRGVERPQDVEQRRVGPDRPLPRHPRRGAAARRPRPVPAAHDRERRRRAAARPRRGPRSHGRASLLGEGGHPRPYRVLYGSPTAPTPQYDFALVPATALPPTHAAALGPERPNPAYAAPRDTRSFVDRNGWVVQAALALAAVALAAVGFLVLRRRA